MVTAATLLAALLLSPVLAWTPPPRLAAGARRHGGSASRLGVPVCVGARHRVGRLDSSGRPLIKLSGEWVAAEQIKVAVFGGGSFGTAMACVLGRKGVQATLVVRRPDVVDKINAEHVNPYYQSDLLLPPSVKATVDAASAFAEADYIFHAVPVQVRPRHTCGSRTPVSICPRRPSASPRSHPHPFARRRPRPPQASRQALTSVAHLVPPTTPIVSLAKGIETSSLCLMSEVIPQCLGDGRPTAFLSGPSFAKEIVMGVATAVTVASTDRALANDLMALFTSESFRALYTPDVVGVEVSFANLRQPSPAFARLRPPSPAFARLPPLPPRSTAAAPSPLRTTPGRWAAP